MSSTGIHRFRLYIVGNSPSSLRAVVNFDKLRQELFANKAEVEVVDILRDPQQAEADHILAVPTLVRLLPKPGCKIIGDLSDTAYLRSFLGF